MKTTTRGIDTENSYPFQSGSSGVTGSCNFNNNSIGSKIVNYISNTQGNEAWLMQAVANIGPISACIHVSENFKNYGGGMLRDLEKI